MTLVDTNVLLDLLTADPRWANWSEGQLEAAALRGPVLINDIIYAELATRYQRIEELNAFVDGSGLIMAPISRSALFIAAKAHLLYRNAGGRKTGVLSDFFIGAQAAAEGIPLLTRDIRKYRTYFPQVELLTPEA